MSGRSIRPDSAGRLAYTQMAHIDRPGCCRCGRSDDPRPGSRQRPCIPYRSPARCHTPANQWCTRGSRHTAADAQHRHFHDTHHLRSRRPRCNRHRTRERRSRPDPGTDGKTCREWGSRTWRPRTPRPLRSQRRERIPRSVRSLGRTRRRRPCILGQSGNSGPSPRDCPSPRSSRLLARSSDSLRSRHREPPTPANPIALGSSTRLRSPHWSREAGSVIALEKKVR